MTGARTGPRPALSNEVNETGRAWHALKAALTAAAPRPKRSVTFPEDPDPGELDLADRHALRRVAGLSTELEDVTEVEYRQLRLENVVLIGVYQSGTLTDADNSLRELASLAETAGARVLDGLLQQRPHPDPSTYLGRGKADELRGIVAALGADTVVADTELAPSQRRALEDVVKVKVIDRTALILDIFSQHAKSREGKAQVELAQLEYLLPRLRGWGESMSRQAGGQVGAGKGMGSRGPGETKIELDRRRIHTRMARLRKQIKGFAPARTAKRANRSRFEVPSVAIVGYTNAGKSSLLNRITSAGVLVENALFATLDATVRRAQTADRRPYTLTDTVGFVAPAAPARRGVSVDSRGDRRLRRHRARGRRRPTPTRRRSSGAVRAVLAEIGAADVPEIVVVNKADAADPIAVKGLQAKRAGMRRRSRPRPGRDRGPARRRGRPAAPARSRRSGCSCRTGGATWWHGHTRRARCSPCGTRRKAPCYRARPAALAAELDRARRRPFRWPPEEMQSISRIRLLRGHPIIWQAATCANSWLTARGGRGGLWRGRTPTWAAG